MQHLKQFNDGVIDGSALHITQRSVQLPEGIYILPDYRLTDQSMSEYVHLRRLYLPQT